MKWLMTALLWSASLALPAWNAQAEEPAKPDATNAEKRLEAKVTFEFEETPLIEVMAFFRQLTDLTFVLDSTITSGKHNPAVNLKVADMPIKAALGWVCKLAECEFEVKENTVHVFVPKVVLQEQAAREKEERAQQEHLANLANTPPARKLRVRFPDGTEIEAEGAIFNDQPELATKLLDRALNLARDGILAYKIDDADEAAGLLTRLARLEPKIKGEYVEDETLLFLTADDAAVIHKAAAFMRKLGHYDVEVGGKKEAAPPMDDPGGGNNNEPVEKAEPPAQPPAPPREDPAKALNF